MLVTEKCCFLLQIVRSGESVRPSVALAIVKLLRLLPPEATRAALPRALQGVANLLRNRLQRIRCPFQYHLHSTLPSV